MTKAEMADRIRELEGTVTELEGKLDDREHRITELDEDVASLKDEVEEAKELVELECRRCHVRFLGHPDSQYCTRDCQYGWTPAPTYEQYYKSLHPETTRC